MWECLFLLKNNKWWSSRTKGFAQNDEQVEDCSKLRLSDRQEVRRVLQSNGAPVFWGRRPLRLGGVDQVRTKEMKNSRRRNEKREEMRRRKRRGRKENQFKVRGNWGGKKTRGETWKKTETGNKLRGDEGEEDEKRRPQKTEEKREEMKRWIYFQQPRAWREKDEETEKGKTE